MIHPSGSDECRSDLGESLIRAFPDHPSREPEYTLAADPQGGLTSHVRPPFGRSDVLAAVDLDVYSPWFVQDIEISLNRFSAMSAKDGHGPDRAARVGAVNCGSADGLWTTPTADLGAPTGREDRYCT
jgi:hypothetical protein